MSKQRVSRKVKRRKHVETRSQRRTGKQQLRKEMGS